MPKTSKLNEYGQFKQALETLGKHKELQYAVFGDYIIVNRKVWETSIARIKEHQLAHMAINGRPS